MGIGDKVRKAGRGLIVAGALAGVLVGGTPVKAGSIEGVMGHKRLTLDTKINVPFGKHCGAFTRGVVNVPYEGKPGLLGLLDLYCNVGAGFGLVGEGVATSGGVSAGGGVQYFKKVKDFSVYALAIAGTDKDLYLQGLLKLDYAPKIKDDMRLLTEIEGLSMFGLDGHKYSIVRARIGPKIGDLTVGAAVDLEFIGDGKKPVYNIGLFLRKDF